jgi:hypothetical protein
VIEAAAHDVDATVTITDVDFDTIYVDSSPVAGTGLSQPRGSASDGASAS